MSFNYLWYALLRPKICMYVCNYVLYKYVLYINHVTVCYDREMNQECPCSYQITVTNDHRNKITFHFLLSMVLNLKVTIQWTRSAIGACTDESNIHALCSAFLCLFQYLSQSSFKFYSLLANPQSWQTVFKYTITGIYTR
jgi:hypothetical protein